METSEFENIIVRSRPDGSFVRIKDIARVELGARTYDFATSFKGQPATMMSLALAPGANAVETAGLIREELERLKTSFPPDVDYTMVVDTTEFVYASIEAVVRTFFEALLLVLLVVFIFLQNWRATLIPMLAVPVSLIATFIAYQSLGFSVNTLSLFGMILAIGIVVDDAIVVVEAVEHHIANGLAPKDATRKAMDEVSAPVVAIALVLAAVFIPMAFIPGVTGQLYKQFALTVAVSVLFSALVALTLTPALCALMLKPHEQGRRRGWLGRLFAAFNRGFEKATERYGRGVRWAIRRAMIMAALLVIVIAGCAALFKIVPSGFVPEEDQGYFFLQTTLPEAASQERTLSVVDEVTRAVLEQPGVESNVAVVGFDILSGTSAPNAAFMVVRLKPWNERTTEELELESIMGGIYARVSRLPEAVILPFNPPPLPGFGATGGFSLMLQAPPGATPEQLLASAQQLIAAARRRPEFGRVYTSFSAATPGYFLEVDREKAKKLGVPVSDVFSTLQAFLGGVQINDFTRFGRNFKVTMQADPAFRQDISELHALFVRNAGGAMVPLDTLITPSNISAPRYLMRYNLYRTAEIGGAPAPGYSTGQVITAMEELARTVLPPDYRYEWSGESRQEIESGGRSTQVFALSIVVTFLFLAALYESWAVPFAVLLSVPTGVLGALASGWMRGLAFDVYAQIGLVTLVGLAAKNAILIVEYAKANRERGMDLDEAAVAASRLRLRPILMTSFAFILGVVPLALAAGAGAASKISVGTSVVGGMTVATLTGIFLIPVLYVLIQRLAERVSRRTAPAVAAATGNGPAGGTGG